MKKVKQNKKKQVKALKKSTTKKCTRKVPYIDISNSMHLGKLCYICGNVRQRYVTIKYVGNRHHFRICRRLVRRIDRFCCHILQLIRCQKLFMYHNYLYSKDLNCSFFYCPVCKRKIK